jgi:subtilase family serine protease
MTPSGEVPPSPGSAITGSRRLRIGFGFLVAIAACTAIFSAQTTFGQTVQLSSTVSREALTLPTYGDLPATQVLSLQLWFRPRSQAQLDSLIAEQQNPNSPQYHKWLTPQEYTNRFGVSQEDFDRVARWLGDQGFQVSGGSPAEGFIKFNGSAASIAHAFNTRILKFSVDGVKFANVTEPEVPAEYAPLVGSITGLNNLHGSKALNAPESHKTSVPAPHSRLNSTEPAAATSASSSPTNQLLLALAEPPVPEITLGASTRLGVGDFYTFYDETPLKNAGITGTGCIAIVGDSDFRPGPISAFNSQFGLPDNSNSIVKVLADGTNPGVNGDEVETLLDLEWSHAVAPGAATKYFLGDEKNSTNGSVVDALHAAVIDGACGVISISFSLCGSAGGFFTSTINAFVQQAQTQGQTILVAAGDDGAAGQVFSNGSCVTGTSANVNELASNPLITSVGGTSFDSSSFSGPGGTIVAHTTERTWDDPNDGIAKGGATGGGASAFFSKPAFQIGTTPNDSARDQPDVALLASPNFPGSFFFNDDGGGGAVLSIVGGTSLSAPMWAGIVNLVSQKSGGNLGSINPTVYKIASAGQSAAGFFDITSGNNAFNGVAGFSAMPGYDQVTGWGTVDINKFVAAYTGSAPSPTPTPTATPTPRVPAVVKVSLGVVNFGKLRIGAAKTKVATLTNTASKKGGSTVTFSGGALSGSSDFSAVTSCNGPVLPKAKCTVTVKFAPSVTGTENGSVTINSNASNSPHTFSLLGIGR